MLRFALICAHLRSLELNHTERKYVLNAIILRLFALNLAKLVLVALKSTELNRAQIILRSVNIFCVQMSANECY